ncbi:MAG: histidine triad nucleotide-binding protein [Tissierellia bacterium]|nr:histidine triad nucleotide-binding protein [Tissierellia bacterium]
MDCIFCAIGAGDVPSDKLYEDPQCVAFRDLSPQAPTHFLVIPKEHIPSLAEFREDQEALLGHILAVIRDLAQREGLEGYRVVTNIGEEGGQSVPHLHFHVLGGRSMTWPPG